ncbi:MAG: RNA polymerase sporulation-specific sigma factor [Parcubacteria group bacterium Licking1014_1]|nr:MAG: RNA polymerase sporulation-specific sigma factor [Parcubacteria group bacterium Licking1014_1]
MPEKFEGQNRELTNREKLLNNILGRENDDPVVSVGNEEERQKEKEQFDSAFKKLSTRDQQIIKLRYGLSEEGTLHTFEEIGKIIELSGERVNQLEKKALKRLGVWRQGKKLTNWHKEFR